MSDGTSGRVRGSQAQTGRVICHVNSVPESENVIFRHCISRPHSRHDLGGGGFKDSLSKNALTAFSSDCSVAVS